MDNKEKKSRLIEISFLNAIFCILVIFIHVSSKPVNGLDKNSWQYLCVMVPWRLSAFVVQGFIFLSGLKLFLNKLNGFSYGKFLVNRLIVIVSFYALWVCIYYAYFCLQKYFSFNLTDLFGHILTGDLVSPFYFVIVICQFYILSPFWIKLFKRTNLVISITISLMLTIILGQNLPDVIHIFIPDYDFPYTDRTFTTYLIYWTKGCYAGLYYEDFKQMLRKNHALLSMFFCVASLVNIFLSYLTFTDKKIYTGLRTFILFIV